MLATPEQRVPKGPGWLFEVKWDGFRAIARVSQGEAKLTSRQGNDLTQRFQQVAKEIPKAVKTPDCVLDGEVCALDEDGRSSFSLMQQGKPGTPIVYYVFDVLEVEGEPVVDLPLIERRKRLEKLLDRRNKTVRLSEVFEDGEALFEAAKQQRLEGIVAKCADSRYAVGRRTRDWLKIKTHGRQEFIIAGYTKGQGRRAGTLGSLVLAVRRGPELQYVGNVGTGFTAEEIEKLMQKLRPLERKTPPFKEVPKMPKIRKGDVVWVEPKLVCEVEFAEWTHDGHLRAPSLPGAARRQGRRGGPPRAPDRGGDPARQAGPQALESRQALLARRGDHEGRPARLLPGRRARARTAPEGPPVHDAALPPTASTARRSSRRTCRRGRRTGSQPCGSRSRPVTSRARNGGSTHRSSTTSWRCSGWRTWPVST